MEKNNVLFKYLSMALPYGVKIYFGGIPKLLTSITIKPGYTEILLEGEYGKAAYCDFISTYNNKEYLQEEITEKCKPYLRTMESMTEEEKEELKSKCIHTETEEDWEGVRCDVWGILILDKYDTRRRDNPIWPSVINIDAIDWLLENHFDFLGLIPKGLAIEINEENNPYKK